MNRCLKKTAVFVLSFLLPFCAFPMEIKSLIPIDGVRWTLETTEGFQNIENSLIASADGNATYTKQVLSARGILFHSFFEDILFTSAQLAFGFSQKQQFLWTEQPDFAHEIDLSGTLRSVELDVQKLFPVWQSRKAALALFGSYSYFEVSYDDEQNGISGDTFVYNSFSGGIQGAFNFSRIFSQSGYVSYSPLVIFGTKMSTVQFLNYGFEFRTETHPVSFTLFYNAKHAFRQEGRTWFNGIYKNMKSSEVGFSFHWNFRKKPKTEY